MQINSKEKIIEHFKNGIKKDQFIGVENEKFLFFKSKNQRIDYDNIRKILDLGEIVNKPYEKVSIELNEDYNINDLKVLKSGLDFNRFENNKSF